MVFEGDLRLRIDSRLPQDFREVGIQGMFVGHGFVFALQFLLTRAARLSKWKVKRNSILPSFLKSNRESCQDGLPKDRVKWRIGGLPFFQRLRKVLERLCLPGEKIVVCGFAGLLCFAFFWLFMLPYLIMDQVMSL